MVKDFIRKTLRMDLEEKILNGGSLLALVCIFFPWLKGEWLGGEVVSYSGLGFYTSFIGLFILLLHVFLLLITLIPLTGGPVLIRKERKDAARLVLSALTVILTLSIWSVLIRFTFEFSRIEVHFGLYGTLIGSIVAALYSFLRLQEQRKKAAHDFFAHPEHDENDVKDSSPPSEPEDHNPYGNLFND